MNTDTTPAMPMPLAGKLPGAQPPKPLPLGPMPGGPPAPLPLPIPAPASSAPPGPLPMAPSGAPEPQPIPSGPPPVMSPFPAPGSPATPPWNVVMQADGSSLYVIPGPNGEDVVIGHNKPPKAPAALQPPKGA